MKGRRSGRKIDLKGKRRGGAADKVSRGPSYKGERAAYGAPGGKPICANAKCKLRKQGCKGFQGCPGYLAR